MKHVIKNLISYLQSVTSPVTAGEWAMTGWCALRTVWFLNFEIAGTNKAVETLFGGDLLWAVVYLILLIFTLTAWLVQSRETRLLAAGLVTATCIYWTLVYCQSNPATIGVPTMLVLSAWFFYSLSKILK